MKTEQVNLRLEPDLVAALEDIAREQGIDRGTLVRKLLHKAIAQSRLDLAMQRYQRGEISIGRAAEDAGVSIYEIMDETRNRGIAYPIDPTEIYRQMAEILAQRPRVAEETPVYDAKIRRGRRKALAVSKGPTLPDREPKPGGVLLVGINPAPKSVIAGHYYQGRLGRRLWKRLERIGLLKDAIPGEEDDAFVKAGHGLSDLVSRPTTSASELTPEELFLGGEGIRARVKSWKPGLVLFVFKQAAAVALKDPNIQAGPSPDLAGVPTFLLSGPYASAKETKRNDDLLRRIVVRLHQG